MANDKQATGREQGRQQSAEAGAARGQQGSWQGHRGTGQEYGAQRAGGQFGGALATRRPRLGRTTVPMAAGRSR